MNIEALADSPAIEMPAPETIIPTVNVSLLVAIFKLSFKACLPIHVPIAWLGSIYSPWC